MTDWRRSRQSPGMRTFIAAGVAALICTACFGPPVSTPATRVTQESPIFVAPPANKVDILFMVDNSLSMDAMQAELRARFGTFLAVFDDLATKGIYPDLHIGVVTSDYGAGDKAKAGGCDASPGGQRGLLQAVGAAASGCSGPTGAPFIKYAYSSTGPTDNLPTGQSLADTFTCMASVGSHGCGFEHQLESVYAALHNTVENAGFLRDDALLAVVFVTNEDDGSAPPTATIYEDDGTTTGPHGAYDTYRQTRYGIACGDPLAEPPYAASVGPLLGCGPAPDLPIDMIGQEYDVSRYATLFTQPKKRGGIKRDPTNQVILVGLDGPATPVQIVTVRSSSGTGVPPDVAYVDCSPVDGTSCVVRVQHSCQNAVQPAFFADPGVRLHSVIAAATNNVEASICGDDLTKAPDFSQVLQAVADKIGQSLRPACIPAILTDSEHPDCVVEDVVVDDSFWETFD